jgi:hypothetical protein
MDESGSGSSQPHLAPAAASSQGLQEPRADWPVGGFMDDVCHASRASAGHPSATDQGGWQVVSKRKGWQKVARPPPPPPPPWHRSVPVDRVGLCFNCL